MFASTDFGLSYLLEWIALVFVALFIWRKVKPPLAKLMADKRDQIATALAEGDEARAAAEALVAERREALAHAREEARAIVEHARGAAEAQVAEGTRRAAEERRRIVERSTLEIEGVRNRIRAEVVAEVGALVVAAAERVVAVELDEVNQHRLIAEAISATEAEVQG